ncbi:unnamed protein product [Mesocestoides corti]|uniref:Tyrosine--tRNA ligase n=1 Tax=Mesocestoides corti TaxID=53468 RepID=A0A0R3UGR5_MESCO|nr:unnamed protein product [Mesocestoides corti]
MLSVGQATSIIGDPTGLKKSRVPLSASACANNSEIFRDALLFMQNNFTEQFLPRFKSVRDPGKFNVMNNLDWNKNAKLLDFVEDIAGFLRYQELAHKDSVKLRESCGSGMSMKEFMYPMIQAYDFFHLYQNYGCCVQLGGNDQVGNIDTGIALIRRKTGANVFGLTVPLLVAADGSKIGKTSSASQDDVIWLSSKKLRPFHFFQKLLNQPDSLMTSSFIRSLSFFSPDEVTQLLTDQKACPSRRPIQRALAQELTLLVHGAGSLQASELASRVLYASSSVNQTRLPPMQALSEGLTSTERNFLVACLAHYTAPLESPIPVIHDKATVSAGPLDRLHEVLKIAVSSECDRGTSLSVEEGGVVLNGQQILKPTPGASKKQCNCTQRMCIRDLFVSSESAIAEAWQAADPVTGFSILRIGKPLAFL